MKYQILIDMTTRIKSQLGAHQLALSTLVMRVNNLAERKKRRLDSRSTHKLMTYQSKQAGDQKIKQLEDLPLNKSQLFEDIAEI